eukprot:3552703-Prymnesium_polylepis.1
MQAGMQIPQELLKESVKKIKTDGVHAMGLKTPKPSLLPIGNKLLERRSRHSLTARLDGVG